MGLAELTRHFIDPLDRADLKYAVTGSVAAMVYGEPRVTLDIDLVIALPVEDTQRLANLYPEADFYAPPPAAVEAEIRRATRGHFNLIHHASGLKADFYPAGDDPLQRFAIEHRRRAAVGETEVWLAPPEFVILRKLEYWREGGSAKHLRDIRAMMLDREAIDLTWLDAQIISRGLADAWRQATVTS